MFSKKFLSKVVATALILATAIPANAAVQFKDVDSTKYGEYLEAINFMSGLGIMVGSNDKKDTDLSNFKPDDNVTRAQVAKILDLALGYGKVVDTADAKSAKFPDVTADNWAAKFIAVAAQKGIIKGSTDGKFTPDGNVTYGQYATMALRALGYADSDLEGAWPLNYMLKASELGLFNKLPKEIDANSPASRKDIAVMTKNMLYTATKADNENNAYIYNNGASNANSNNNLGDNLTSRPRYLIDNVKKIIGVQDLSGVVVADKTTDASLGDKVTINTNIPTNNVDLNASNKSYTVSLNIPDDVKKTYVVGSKVDFWVSTNISTNNSVIYDATTAQNTPIDNKTYLVDVTKHNPNTGDLKIARKSNAVTATVDDSTYTWNSNAYLIVNNQYWGKLDAKKADFTNPKKGIVDYADAKLFDYDGDKKIDLAIINQELRPQVVSKDYAVADKAIKVFEAFNDGEDNSSIAVDPAKVKVTGDVTTLDAIKANDVVYVTKTMDGTVVNVNVKRAVVTGLVTYAKVDNAKSLVTALTIDGKVYNVDSQVQSIQVKAGDTVSFIAGKPSVDSPDNLTVQKYTGVNIVNIDLSNYGFIVGTDTSTSALGYTTVAFKTLNNGMQYYRVENAYVPAFVPTSTPNVLYRYFPNGVVSNVTKTTAKFVDSTDASNSYIYTNFNLGSVIDKTKVYGVQTTGNANTTVAVADQVYDLTNQAQYAASLTGPTYTIYNPSAINAFQPYGYSAVVKVTGNNIAPSVLWNGSAIYINRTIAPSTQWVNGMSCKVYTLIGSSVPTLAVKPGSLADIKLSTTGEFFFNRYAYETVSGLLYDLDDTGLSTKGGTIQTCNLFGFAMNNLTIVTTPATATTPAVTATYTINSATRYFKADNTVMNSWEVQSTLDTTNGSGAGKSITVVTDANNVVVALKLN